VMLFLAAAKATPVFGLFNKGVVSQFFLVLFFSGLIWVMITRARGGMKIPEIRKIPGLEAVDEAIGRATEMGRPVHYTVGLGGLGDAQTLAGLAVQSHVAKLCAKYDTRFINTTCDWYVMTISEEIVKQAYLEVGRPDAFNREDIRYLSDFQFAYANAVMGLFQRELPAANIMIGAFWAESLIFAETGSMQGAIQIAGTANTHQLPFFITACDYCLIGEEIYAASAYLSKEPLITGSVIGQDWGKVVVFGLIILGTIIGNWLKDLLSK
jgi:hypothetical protein